MRPDQEVEHVRGLIRAGLSDSEIARRTRIPRTTIRDWRRTPHRSDAPRGWMCPRCTGDERSLGRAYVYLLGMYLGDGHISPLARGVFRLRLFLDLRYPQIIEESAAAIREVAPANRVGSHDIHHPDHPAGGLRVLTSYSKHWPCLFPQHGPGPKHLRSIALEDWQNELVDVYPGDLLRGLIHSDGWRGTNRVVTRGTAYTYPRYQFTNASADVKRIFTDACDRLGIEWRPNSRMSISVAKRAAVARLDEHVGPKA